MPVTADTGSEGMLLEEFSPKRTEKLNSEV
jgi:hypothetical protein